MTKQDKTQIMRHIFIDNKIRQGMRSGCYANCSSMAKEYEVSSKSILRDIDFLKNQCDAPIDYDSSKKGYFYTEENFKLPAININASDLFAICIAEKVLKQHEDTPIYDKLTSVFSRIEESLPEKVSINPSWINQRISIQQSHKTNITTKVWEQVAEALQRSQTMTIQYLKPGAKNPKARDTDPYHLINYQGEWYLICYCHLRQKILTFALSRIKKATLTSKGFNYPKEFDYQKFSNLRFGIFSGKETHTIKIHFDKKHTPYVQEREWHPTQKIFQNDSGGITLQFESNHLFEIKQWVLSWGHGAKVLEPEELRKDIIKELNNSLKQY